jgi:beta-lactamase superfamily II metal-dependent hydrolase
MQSRNPFRWKAALGLALLCVHAAAAQTVGQPLPKWSPGTLDIHQIQTGRGNSAFLIFPDGTTLLIDAGAVSDRPGLATGPARPDATRSPGEWIAQYIRDFSPVTPAALDYALITHYHDDHMAGIDVVGKSIPIRKLIDRGDTPAPPPGPLTDRYRAFRAGFGGKAETLRPGRADQIEANRTGTRYPDFEVRNVAANGEIWTGQGETTRQAFPQGWSSLAKDLQPGENSFSLALRIRYGRFRYFTGGDVPGTLVDNLPSWHDLETPIARAIGPVDVLVLDHHGWLDTTNPFFLQTLQPRAIVVPAWHASHPDHGVLRRVLSSRVYPGPADVFLTTLLPAPRAVFGYLGEPFKSSEGHIVVRVEPGGASYRVVILDDGDSARRVRAVYGPYTTRP